MSEIEAVKNIKAYMYYAPDELPRNVRIALTEAMAALREQAEREKGCVFCNDKRHSIREVFDEGTAKIINAESRYALSVHTSRDAAIFNIFCCPICGKKLEVEHGN